jgi:hypothetical protein
MEKQQPHYEQWYDAGRDLKMVRCSCWRHLIIGGVADNNGWHPADRPYPHAPYCPARPA